MKRCCIVHGIDFESVFSCNINDKACINIKIMIMRSIYFAFSNISYQAMIKSLDQIPLYEIKDLLKVSGLDEDRNITYDGISYP